MAQLVTRAHLGPLLNAVTHAPGLARLATSVAGLEDREVPLFAPETLQQWWRRRTTPEPATRPSRGTVLLWPDTFTNTFSPHIGQAAVDVLERAGWRVEIPTEPLCCGLTWISTGQLGTAKRVLRRTVDRLADHVRDGGLVVGLEPSCTAVFRNDASDLFPTDQDVRRLRDHTVTFAELLTRHTEGWQPPRLDEVDALAQVHCHQHAVLGWDADQQLLQDAGVDLETLESGCCGLAGNFGFTAGHGEVSRALAEQVLLPRLRAAPAGTVALADGFSCRTQIHELDSGGHEAVHLAELVSAGYHSARVDGSDLARHRPEPPTRTARLAAVGAGILGASVGTWAAGSTLVRLRRSRPRD
jgi:Fe-S oxidoreductase